MKVRAEFFTMLREATGKQDMEVSFLGNTVMDLLCALNEMFSGAFGEQLMEGEELKGLVKVFVNGQDVRGLRGLYTELKDGDTVSFFPPAAGG